MKFMITWKIAPGFHKPAGEGVLKTGAPPPEGLTIHGRWHGPGSVTGWALAETSDARLLHEHISQWANFLEIQVTPVVEDADASQSLAKVYGS